MKIKGKSMEYDIIRVIALMMIVMVHVSAYMVIYFPDTANAEWAIGNFFNGIARAGVPMFILLSGALLLNEDKSFDTKKFYKRNLMTMVWLTIGWLLAYAAFYTFLPLLDGKSPVWSDFLLYLISFKGTDYPHLWYMLMVIGMYLMIPVLRLFVKRENKSYIIGIIIVALIFQFGATTADFFTRGYSAAVSDITAKFHLEPATGFIGLLLTGWFLNEYTFKKKTRVLLYGAGVAMAAISIFLVYSMIDTVGNIRDYMFEALSLPAFVYATALFVFLQSAFKGKAAKGKALSTLADCSFGMYLIHVAVMEIFVRVILPYENFGTGKPFTYILILYAFTLAVSFTVVYLTGLIKGARKIFFNR